MQSAKPLHHHGMCCQIKVGWLQSAGRLLLACRCGRRNCRRVSLRLLPHSAALSLNFQSSSQVCILQQCLSNWSRWVTVCSMAVTWNVLHCRKHNLIRIDCFLVEWSRSNKWCLRIFRGHCSASMGERIRHWNDSYRSLFQRNSCIFRREMDRASTNDKSSFSSSDYSRMD